jgi:hypothetical protein
MLVLRLVTPCGLVGRHQRFDGTYCLHNQDRTEGSIFLRNVGIYLEVHYNPEQHPTSSAPSEHQTSGVQAYAPITYTRQPYVWSSVFQPGSAR